MQTPDSPAPAIFELKPNNDSPIAKLLKDYNIQPGQTLICSTDENSVEICRVEANDPSCMWSEDDLEPYSEAEAVKRLAKDPV